MSVQSPKTVSAEPKNIHWGYFDASLEPVAAVDSGDIVRVETVSGNPAIIRETPYQCSEDLLAIHREVERRMLPGHICTGPIAVRGAMPGDVLQVDIREVELTSDWGYAAVRPLAGALPDDFEERRASFVPIDREKRTAKPDWSVEIPLRPFFGVVAVAPPPAWGEVSTRPPRRNGGNIDNKELVAGTTLYLPVFVEGALFSVGDGHAVQGDGEICSQALETDLTGTFRLAVRKDLHMKSPLALTPTHVITMAFDPDLDDCVVSVVRQMIDLLCRDGRMDRHQAYTLLSFIGDLRITQVVNLTKGVHLMVERRYFEGDSLPV